MTGVFRHIDMSRKEAEIIFNVVVRDKRDKGKFRFPRQVEPVEGMNVTQSPDLFFFRTSTREW